MAETPFTPGSTAAEGAPRDDGPRTAQAEPVAAAGAAEITDSSAQPQVPDGPETVAAAGPGTPAQQAQPSPAVAPPAALQPGLPPQPDAEPMSQPASGAEHPPQGVAATLLVPPLEDGESAGGEWELLLSRVRGWLASGEPRRQWERIRGPLKGVALLVIAALALRVYATVVATIDSLPLISGLLELTGLLALVRFSVTRLLRAEDRRRVLGDWQLRWQRFQGRS